MKGGDWAERGNRKLEEGDLDGAIECYETAIAADPAHAMAHYRAALVLQHLGRHAEADEHYGSAVEVEPELADAWVDWGNLAYGLGDPAAAISRLETALEAVPDHRRALHNLATILLADGDFDSARDLFERAIAAGNAESRLGLANAQSAAGDLETAVRSYEAIIAADRGNAVAHYQLGLALQRLGRFEAALSHYREAARLRPGFLQPLVNSAQTLMDMGDLGGAEETYRRVIGSDDPAFRARGEFGLSQLALRRQDFEHGWAGYERRLDIEADGRRWETKGAPRLGKRDLEAAGRVAIWSEQGIGDQILFSTLLPEVVDAGIEAVVEIDPRLAAAFRRSLPALRFATGTQFEEAFDRCRFQLPLGSLAQLFRPNLDSFARQPRALLKADPARVAQVRASLDDRPKIGISWRSIQPLATRFLESAKSAPLEHFGVFDGTGATLVDLQYGDLEEERGAFDDRHPRLRRRIAGLDAFNDLEAVMAAIEACDLVITTSNATAHLAGAVGKRTWLLCLAANPPFHYWVPGDDGHSLWYPSVEVVTDRSWRTWEAAFEAVSRRFISGSNRPSR
jgi:tetratricopeptide (TPR) repeat protein